MIAENQWSADSCLTAYAALPRELCLEYIHQNNLSGGLTFLVA